MNTLIYLRLVIFTFKFICISMKTKHSNMGVWHNHVNTSTLTAPCLNVGRCSKLETRQTSLLARCSGIQTTWPEFMWTGANNSTGVEGWFGFCGCKGMGVRLETQAWRNDHHSGRRRGCNEYVTSWGTVKLRACDGNWVIHACLNNTFRFMAVWIAAARFRYPRQ